MTIIEELEPELEQKAKQYEGDELKSEVEELLEESGLDYSVEAVGGLEQPKHKSYTYEVDTGEKSYELSVILWDGRPGHEDGSINLTEKSE